MHKESGFTIIELAIVIAIVGVLSAIAIPNGLAWVANGRVNSAARDIVSMLQRARIEAVRQSAFVAVQFDAAGNYAAFLDDGEGTADADLNGILDGAGDWTQNGTERTVIAGQLPPGVTLSGNPFNVLAPTLTGMNNRFNARSMPSISGDIVVTNSRGHSVTVELTTGGNILVQ